MTNIQIKKTVTLFFVGLLLITKGVAQQSEIVNADTTGHFSKCLPGACTNNKNNLNSPKDGSQSLGQTYSYTACGLSYVQASQKVTTRYTTPTGSDIPCSLVISGIPSCYAVEKAYLYWIESYTSGSTTSPVMSFTNPSSVTNNYSPTMIGQSGDKCWTSLGEVGTRAFRTDVTSAITGSGNGTYTINSISGITSWEIDGATLIIIYRNTSASWKGTLIIDDGIMTYQGGTYSHTMSGFSACGTGSNADAFLIVADMQDNVSATFSANINSTAGTFPKEFYNFALVNTTVSSGQSSSSSDINDYSDCYAVAVAGLYFQTTTCGACTSSPMTLSTSTVPATCSNCNGSATVTATGGSTPYSYSWSTSPVQTSATATNLCAGTYTVTVSDASGCNSATASVNITSGSSTPVSVSPTAPTICAGSSVSLTASGTNTYSWSPSTGLNTTTGATVVANPSSTTTYIVTGTDLSGCTSSASVTVTVNPLPAADAGLPQSICTSTPVTLTASGGGTYLWNTGPNTQSITVTPASTTTYTVTVTLNGCTASDDVTVTVSGAIVAQINPYTNATCGLNNGTATATGGTTYLWSGGQVTATITGLAAGTYTVTVSSGASCSASASVTIVSITPPTVTATSTDENCGNADGTASSNVTNGTTPYTYLWNSGQMTQNITNLPALTYIITVTDADGCTTSAQVVVSNIAGPSLQIVSTTDDVCSYGNGSATVNAIGGQSPYTYQWSNTQTSSTATGLYAGVYSCTVTDANNCTAMNSATISDSPGPSLTSSSMNEFCDQANGSATINPNGGTPPYTYLWSNGQTTQTASGLTQGSYTVTVNDQNCSAVMNVNVMETPGPDAGFSAHPKVLTIMDGPVTFTDNSSGNVVNWNWNFGDGSIGSGEELDHPYSNIGIYLVTLIVTDNNGCMDTVVDTIKVKDIFTFYIPNAFSPNDDGFNEHFAPQGVSVDPDNFEMYIFDRWGNMMFETRVWDVNLHRSESWNGTKGNKGTFKDVVMDVYIYHIKVKEIDGPKHEYIGRISMIP